MDKEMRREYVLAYGLQDILDKYNLTYDRVKILHVSRIIRFMEDTIHYTMLRDCTKDENGKLIINNKIKTNKNIKEATNANLADDVVDMLCGCFKMWDVPETYAELMEMYNVYKLIPAFIKRITETRIPFNKRKYNEEQDNFQAFQVMIRINLEKIYNYLDSLDRDVQELKDEQVQNFIENYRKILDNIDNIEYVSENEEVQAIYIKAWDEIDKYRESVSNMNHLAELFNDLRFGDFGDAVNEYYDTKDKLKNLNPLEKIFNDMEGSIK